MGFKEGDLVYYGNVHIYTISKIYSAEGYVSLSIHDESYFFDRLALTKDLTYCYQLPLII